jgi:hypothetical protein
LSGAIVGRSGGSGRTLPEQFAFLDLFGVLDYSIRRPHGSFRVFSFFPGATFPGRRPSPISRTIARSKLTSFVSLFEPEVVFEFI